MSDDKYTVIKITTRHDGSISNLDFSSYVPDSDAVSAMMRPIIDAVAATANDNLRQRQQGREQSREFFAAMMKEACVAEAAEMTGSDETEPSGASEAEKAVDVLVERMKSEKVVAAIKRLVNAIS